MIHKDNLKNDADKEDNHTNEKVAEKSSETTTTSVTTSAVTEPSLLITFLACIFDSPKLYYVHPHPKILFFEQDHVYKPNILESISDSFNTFKYFFLFSLYFMFGYDAIGTLKVYSASVSVYYYY